MPLLLHITDTHIYSDAGQQLKEIETRQSFAAVVNAAHKKFPDADAVVLGGDLAQDESEAAYKHVARSFIHWHSHVHAITGNHDDMALMEKVLNPTVRFEREIGIFKLGNWQVLLLNTQKQGAIGGELTLQQFEQIKQAVKVAEDKHLLLVMHHQPVPVGSHWLDAIGLDNGELLIEMAAQHTNIRGLLFGHVHQQFDDSCRHARIMGTPSTCIQFKPDCDNFMLDNVSPGYRWLQLNEDGSIETGVERVEGFIPTDLSDNTKY